MAKIKIEKKNRNTRLVWILVLFIFILLGIIWWLGTDDETTGGENRPVTGQPVLDKTSTTTGYHSFVSHQA